MQSWRWLRWRAGRAHEAGTTLPHQCWPPRRGPGSPPSSLVCELTSLSARCRPSRWPRCAGGFSWAPLTAASALPSRPTCSSGTSGRGAPRKARSTLPQRPAAAAAAAHRHPFCRRPSKPQPSRPASRPKSGATPTTGSASKGGKRGGMGQAAAAAAASPPAAAGADELRQRAELLERGLRAEEAARNYMQLERVRMMSMPKWEVLRCCLPVAVYRRCRSTAGTVLHALQPARPLTHRPLSCPIAAGQGAGVLGHHQAGAGGCPGGGAAEGPGAGGGAGGCWGGCCSAGVGASPAVHALLPYAPPLSIPSA